MAVGRCVTENNFLYFTQLYFDNKSGFYFTNGEDWFVAVDRHVETTRGRESS